MTRVVKVVEVVEVTRVVEVVFRKKLIVPPFPPLLNLTHYLTMPLRGC